MATEKARERARDLLDHLREALPIRDPIRLGRDLLLSSTDVANLVWKDGKGYVVRVRRSSSWDVTVEAIVHEYAHARVGDRFSGSCLKHALHDEHWGVEYSKAYRIAYETT